MIRINNIRIPLGSDLSDLRGICTGKLRINAADIKSVRLSKKSVDARKKSDVHFIISLDIEARNEDKLLSRIKDAVRTEKKEYMFLK